MRYMMFIKHPGDYDVNDVPPSLFPAMGALVEEHIKNGMFIDGGGLKPLSKATRVRRIHWPTFEGEAELRPLEDMGETAPS